MTYQPYLNRGFGVEMEMNEVNTDLVRLNEGVIREALYRGATVAGASRSRVNRREASYYRSDGTTWDIKHDGSCRYGLEYGFEVASPALTMVAGAGCRELEAMCMALTELRPRVDRKCGLHVTVDCSDFAWWDVQRLLVFWTRYEPFFFSLQPESRRDNHYCRPLRATRWTDTGNAPRDLVQAMEAIRETDFRYAGSQLQRDCGINLTGWWRTGRIEFRLGAGTVNYEKIRRWSQLLLSFVGRVHQPMAEVEASGGFISRSVSVLYMFKQLGLAESDRMPASEIAPESAELRAWCEARHQRFNTTRTTVGEGRPHDPMANAIRRAARAR